MQTKDSYLERHHRLFTKYEKRFQQGVKQGHLFLNAAEISQTASEMATWHLETEDQPSPYVKIKRKN